MSELRQDPVSRDWVIVSPERAHRPHEAKLAASRECPFCPGQESSTPRVIFSINDDEGLWQLRVVPNRFPALKHHSAIPRLTGGPWSWPRLPGYGSHEVVIESRDHGTTLGLMSLTEARRLLEAYVRRYRDLAASDSRLRQIIVFRNHGERAGASIEHPHSQIIATPVVSPFTRRRTLDEIAFFDTTGRCGHCHQLLRERRSQVRLVLESDRFVSYAPFASSGPYRLVVVPRRHTPSFADILEDELDDLAEHVSRVLKAIYHLLSDPAYNLVITSPPLDLIHAGASHWAIDIVPRLTTPAGFEMGSGILVNTKPPEVAAAELREQIKKLEET